MRLLMISLLLPLVAFWLWWPIAPQSHAQRRRRVAGTLAVILLLPALMLIWRWDLVGYALLSGLQVVSGMLLVAGLLLLCFLVLRDLGWALHALLERLLRWSPGIGVRRWHAPWLTRSAIVLAVLASAHGTWNGLKVPEVRVQEVVINGLPPALEGLRIAVLADLHITPVKGRARTEGIVARTLAAAPDLIVLPGDMVDGPVTESGAMVAPLAGLRAPLGVWLAPGNHEVYHDYADWMAFFGSLGLPVLENRVVRLNHGGVALDLSGLGDLAARRPAVRSSAIPGPELAATLAQRSPDVPFHLMLVHQPKMAREVAARGAVDLQISGHTHGGHILGMDRWLVAPANDGFVRDRYDVEDMVLFVSGGAGQWDGFSARLGVPPRIDLLVLRSP